MSKSIDHYNKGSKHRTLESIRKCADLSPSQPANKRLGVQNPPMLNVEPDHVVVDELHLLLRVADVLLTDLVSEMVLEDRRTRHTHSTCSNHEPHLKVAT